MTDTKIKMLTAEQAYNIAEKHFAEKEASERTNDNQRFLQIIEQIAKEAGNGETSLRITGEWLGGGGPHLLELLTNHGYKVHSGVIYWGKEDIKQ